MSLLTINLLPLRILVVALAIALAAPFSVADPAVHFELRLAPGQDDAVLTLGDPQDDTLAIEVWAEVSDPPPGLEIYSFAVYPRVTVGGVVSYNGDATAPLFAFAVIPTDPNVPASGDLSIAPFDGGGVSAGLGHAAHWATFTISALDVGTTGYTFGNNLAPPPWHIMFSDTTTMLVDSDCTDGFCNVTGWVDPRLQHITVVQPVRSADADEDGDVDLRDFLAFQECTEGEDGGASSVSPGCERLDLNADQQIDSDDLALFVPQLTGARPRRGDLDGDADVDLADYARMQFCLAADAEVANAEQRCLWADADHDGQIAEADLQLLVEQLTGPGD